MKDNILYIDDEQANLDAFKFVFFRDYNIFLAKCTEEAEGILREHDIKVVITDQKMPEESGTCFIERIKSKYTNLIYILLTAHAEIDVVIDAINTGVIKRYIVKPYEKEEIKLAIANAIDEYDLRIENKKLVEQLKKKNEELSLKNEHLAKANEELNSGNKELLLAKKKIETSEQLKSDILAALNNVALVSIANLDGVITQVNDEFCNICGYSREELIGSTHQMLSSKYHSKEFWSNMWKTIKSGNTWRGEVKNQAKSGEYFWGDTVISPVKNSAGQVYEYLSVRYLITDKKILHKQREKLLSDLEQYAFITSHKIRGPLSRVMGISMLINRSDLSETEKSETYCHLESSVQELNCIISEMNQVLNRTSYPLHQRILQTMKNKELLNKS